METEGLEILGSLAEAATGVILVCGLFVLAICIFAIVTGVLFYKKCNKPGWAAIIPFYSSWVECEIAGLHWLMFVFMILSSALSTFNISTNETINTIVSLLYLFAYVVTAINISKKFHKGTGFTIGLIFLPIIFIPILTYSKNCVYDENLKVKNAGIFDINF